MANNMASMQGCCTCDTVNPPCPCGNDETAVVGTWDNTAADPCAIVGCICKMYIWLVEFSLEWRSGVTPPTGCHFVDGAFVLTPDNSNTIGCVRSSGPRTGPCTEGAPLCCGDVSCPTPFNAVGVCRQNCPSLVVSVTCEENGSGDPVLYWAAQLRDRILLDVCNDFIWWNAYGAGDLITTVTPGMSFDLFDDYVYLDEQPLYVINAKVTVYGKVCGGDLDGDGEPEVPEDVRCNNKCGLSVDFTIEDIGGCRFAITNVTDGGECGIKKYIWSDGYSSPDPERPIYVVGGGCGEQSGETITLWVIDDKDCVYEKTKTLPDCCRCQDEDAENCNEGIGGTLTVTLIDEATCEYELCASVPAASALCGDDATSFIEYQLDGGGCLFPDDDCDCLDVEADSCMPVGCGRGLTNGECDTVTVDRTTQLRWRVWDKPCGCPGPWNYEELVCNPCECCDTATDGVLDSIDITIGAIDGTGTDGTCTDCDDYNTVYNVPVTAPCYGNDTFTRSTGCSHNQLLINWQITCTDTSTTLTVNVQTGPSFPAFITFEKTITHASGVIIDCSELAGDLTRVYCSCDGSALVKCNAEDITASAALNFAA